MASEANGKQNGKKANGVKSEPESNGVVENGKADKKAKDTRRIKKEEVKESKGFEVVPAEPDIDSDEDGYENNPYLAIVDLLSIILSFYYFINILLTFHINFREGKFADEDSSLDEADQNTDDEKDIDDKVEVLLQFNKRKNRRGKKKEKEKGINNYAGTCYCNSYD